MRCVCNLADVVVVVVSVSINIDCTEVARSCCSGSSSWPSSSTRQMTDARCLQTRLVPASSPVCTSKPIYYIGVLYQYTIHGSRRLHVSHVPFFVAAIRSDMTDILYMYTRSRC